MVRTRIKGFLLDENGATAVEYALIAAIISVSIVASMKMISNTLNADFNSVASGLQSAGQ